MDPEAHILALNAVQEEMGGKTLTVRPVPEQVDASSTERAYRQPIERDVAIRLGENKCGK
jgi:hypothetical protein